MAPNDKPTKVGPDNAGLDTLELGPFGPRYAISKPVTIEGPENIGFNVDS